MTGPLLTLIVTINAVMCALNLVRGDRAWAALFGGSAVLWFAVIVREAMV